MFACRMGAVAGESERAEKQGNRVRENVPLFELSSGDCAPLAKQRERELAWPFPHSSVYGSRRDIVETPSARVRIGLSCDDSDKRVEQWELQQGTTRLTAPSCCFFVFCFYYSFLLFFSLCIRLLGAPELASGTRHV